VIIKTQLIIYLLLLVYRIATMAIIRLYIPSFKSMYSKLN